MIRTILGTVHGKTIELNEDPGAADGQTVEVRITLVQDKSAGAGIHRSAGGWANYPELDSIFGAIQEARKVERRSQFNESE